MKSLEQYLHFQGVELSRVSAEDIEPLVAVINAAYSYQDSARSEPRTTFDKLRQRVAETEFYVAKFASEIIGCVYLEQKGQSMHFGLLTVIGKLRGSGLAPSLIVAIEAYAQDLGCTLIELDYMSVAPWLKSYYETYGYSETGQVEEWDTIGLVRMSKIIVARKV
jgi:GNAT superfamily N-acetyltransferase